MDLARTVFSRKEKAQQTTVLRALVTKDAVERWGLAAVAAALGVAAEVPDERVAGRARTRLDALGVAAVAPDVVPIADLWEASVPAWEPAPAQPIQPTEPAITAAASAYRSSRRSIDDALVLDAVVRLGGRGRRRASASSGR